MLRKLLATTLLLATACAPLPQPPTQPPATASAVATVPPTDAPPDRTFHPSRMSPVLGRADVMAIVCNSVTTTIAGYSWGLEWHYDDAAYQECVKAGKV